MSLFCLLQIRRMGRRGQQLVLAVHPVAEGLRERPDEAPLGARGGRDPRDAEAGSGGGGGALDGAGGRAQRRLPALAAGGRPRRTSLERPAGRLGVRRAPLPPPSGAARPARDSGRLRRAGVVLPE